MQQMKAHPPKYSTSSSPISWFCARAPRLTGLGEAAHLMRDAIDLHTHIQDILGVLQWEELADVVLCGHSYGGMVISGVADRVPEQLRSLVYLDAFVPDNGTCLMDYVPPEQV